MHIPADCSTKNSWNTSLRKKTKQKHVPWFFNDMFGLQCVLIDKSVGAVTGRRQLAAKQWNQPHCLTLVFPFCPGFCTSSTQNRALSQVITIQIAFAVQWVGELGGRWLTRSSVSLGGKHHGASVTRISLITSLLATCVTLWKRPAGRCINWVGCCFPTSKRSFCLVLWEGFP